MKKTLKLLAFPSDGPVKTSIDSNFSIPMLSSYFLNIRSPLDSINSFLFKAFLRDYMESKYTPSNMKLLSSGKFHSSGDENFHNNHKLHIRSARQLFEFLKISSTQQSG